MKIKNLKLGESIIVAAFDETYFENYAGSGKDYKNIYTQYSESAKDLDRLFKFHKIPVKKILDAGCAYGYIVNDLRKLGYDAEGIDISDTAIKNIPPHVKPFCRQMDMRDISSIGTTYDLVFINSAMYLTEEEIISFLTDLKNVTSYIYIINPYIGDSVNDKERVTLKPRNWWKRTLVEIGWNPYPGTDFLCKLKT